MMMVVSARERLGGECRVMQGFIGGQGGLGMFQVLFRDPRIFFG